MFEGVDPDIYEIPLYEALVERLVRHRAFTMGLPNTLPMPPVEKIDLFSDRLGVLQLNDFKAVDLELLDRINDIQADVTLISDDVNNAFKSLVKVSNEVKRWDVAEVVRHKDGDSLYPKIEAVALRAAESGRPFVMMDDLLLSKEAKQLAATVFKEIRDAENKPIPFLLIGPNILTGLTDKELQLVEKFADKQTVSTKNEIAINTTASRRTPEASLA